MSAAAPPFPASDLLGPSAPPAQGTVRLTPAQRLRRLVNPPRISGLDVARALAIMGMIGAHVGAIPDFDPTVPLSYLSIVHGNSSILFAVLAGVSIALVTGRTRLPDPADLPRLRMALLGRGAAIFLIGLALEMLGTMVAVILTFYGALYIASLPVLRWNRRRLVLVALGIALLGPVLVTAATMLSLSSYGAGATLVLTGVYRFTTWAPLMLIGMAIGRTDLSRARVAAAIAGIGALVCAVAHGLALVATLSLGALSPDLAAQLRPGSMSSSWSSSSSASTSVIDEDGTSSSGSSVYDDGTVPAESVDMTGMVCYPPMPGDPLVLCGTEEDLVGPSESSSWSSGSVTGWEAYPQSLQDQSPLPTLVSALVSTSPHSGGTLEIFASGGLALLVIGLCLLIGRPLRWVLLPLSAMGSMPLTAYSLHIVAILAIGGPMSFISSNGIWLALVLGLLALCTLWAALLGRGPLERLTAWAARRSAGAAGPARPAPAQSGADAGPPAPAAPAASAASAASDEGPAAGISGGGPR